MNDELQSQCRCQGTPPLQARFVSSCNSGSRFFESVDWLSFSVTATAALAVYLLTLAPEVTLERQGVFTTGAFYAGVPHPPGYPLWTLYAWLFTELLPVSNIAWRVAVSSAIAGALTCGLLALLVSRIGTGLLQQVGGISNLPRKQEKRLRIVAGYAAGMAFGFSNQFWGLAVVGDVWPLSMLLLAWVICLLLRWFHDPARRRYLVAASLVYGLTLTNSQALAPAAPGLAMLVALGSNEIGRDGLVAVALLLATSITTHFLGLFPWILEEIGQTDEFGWYYIGGGLVTFVVATGLTLTTRKLFTEWKTVVASGSALLLGLSLYLYLPIASMTNPPVNWGYPRAVFGFVHDLRRGQFERIRPVESPARLAEATASYVKVLATDFGWIFLAPAAFPFLVFRKLQSRARLMMLGTLAVFVSLSLVLVYFLNPMPYALGLDAPYYAGSYLIVALWTGWGMILAGGMLAHRGQALPSSAVPPR